MLQSFAVEGRATPALLQHALVATTLSAGSAKPTANTQVEKADVYQCSPSQEPGEVCVSATGQYLENGNRILATHRGCDMRKQRSAQDQTFASMASTRCQQLHAAKGGRDNEAHSVEQESDKQVSNTVCDTQKEANKRELRKWTRKSGEEHGVVHLNID